LDRYEHEDKGWEYYYYENKGDRNKKYTDAKYHKPTFPNGILIESANLCLRILLDIITTTTCCSVMFWKSNVD
jgi:hypothetical protein